MAKTKSNTEMTRVNINVPTKLVERVKNYADELGINTTSAYIVLLNQMLDQIESRKYMPYMEQLITAMHNNPQSLDEVEDSVIELANYINSKDDITE